MVQTLRNGDRIMLRAKKTAILIICLSVLSLAFAAAEGLTPLPLDTLAFGSEPKNENYLSENEYLDDSIHVEIYEGRYVDTRYIYAHVKISDPSQFRTAPAGVYYAANATFTSTGTMRGRYVAKIVNAVVAINGDYYTKSDKCFVVMRQTVQYRNSNSNGEMDALIVDQNGDFDYIRGVTKQSYLEYYEKNADSMYQAFCFGPVLVENGESVIDESYSNGQIGSGKDAQRSAIAQIGPLEYLLITSEGPEDEDGNGMTILEFAQLCEDLGYRHSDTGCRLAFNLDGGSSTTLIFKRPGGQYGNLLYTKINAVTQERLLGDIIYFATLVK